MDWFWADLQLRLIGTAGGVIIAFAMSNDARTWSGLGRRLLVSVVFGIFLADPVAAYIGLPASTPRQTLAASCAAASIGWWIMHALIRAMQFWNFVRKP